jgi:hypothetical protein
MSRSRRKTPIMGVVCCSSERIDKKFWHQKWRTKERALLGSASPDTLAAHLPILERQVSDSRGMNKDGHQYFPLRRQRDAAHSMASVMTKDPDERRSIIARTLHRWMGK